MRGCCKVHMRSFSVSTIRYFKNDIFKDSLKHLSLEPRLTKQTNIKKVRQQVYNQKQIIHRQHRDIQELVHVINNLRFKICELKGEIEVLEEYGASVLERKVNISAYK